VIVVYDEHSQQGQNSAFHTSTNLKQRELQNQLPGYFECTELFDLPVNGKADDTRGAAVPHLKSRRSRRTPWKKS